MESSRQGTKPSETGYAYAHLTVTVPASADAGLALRRAVRSLDRYCGPKTADDVELLVTELATNGVKHAEMDSNGNRITLDARVDPHVLRVAVRDRGQGFEPEPRPADRTEPGGWGLMLVDGIATRWGVEREPNTTVWFELPLAA
jgi:anti-sigma regulatory factor (Ser/Thr protein kinase)